MRLCIIACCVLISHEVGAKDYTINVLESVQSEQQKRSAEQFFIALYQPLGIQPKFVYYPSIRGLNLVNDGKLDAEASRFHVIGQNYKNLLQVPEPLGEFTSGLFCLSEQECKFSPSTSIALAAGFESAVLFCQHQNLNCRKETQIDNIVKLIDDKWVDAAFLQTTFAAQIICLSEHKRFYVNLSSELRSYSYHYVYEAHKDLVPALVQSAKEIKQSQQYEPDRQVLKTQLEACGKSIELVE